MRFGFWAMTFLALAACDQATTGEPEAAWTGSIGRLVADGQDPAALTFARLDDAGPEHGGMTLISGDDPDAGKAVRLETLGQPPRMESLQARLLTTGDIDAGSVCWLRFETRAVEPQVELGLGRLSIMVRGTRADQEPLVHRSIYLRPAWTPIDVTFEASAAVDAGEAEIVFGVGTQLQVVDLGGVSMRCFADDDAPPGLSQTSFSYAGREPEASWRATAESQIERYRKGDLSIEVNDESGQPVNDAEIHIQMSRHAFQFGAAIDPTALAGVDDDGNQGKTASYRQNLKELFNTITLESGVGWPAWTDESDRQAIEDALAWGRSLDLDLCGKRLVSSKMADLPPALQERRNEPEAVREAVRAGVEATAGDLAERVDAWNVVDRPREQHDLLDLLGWDEMATWFQVARSAAPNAKLVLNESEILAGDRMAELATLLGNLIADDVPIDRIGVQGQFGAQPPPIQVLSDRLDQLASFGLPLMVTAFDMATADDRLLQDFARDFLTLAFSHPSVEGFVFGQFWEDADGPLGAAIYRSDGAISPIGKIYRDLVLQRWWTDIVARSNAEGELSSRVFQGDYMISARKDDQRAAATVSLGPKGAKVTLTLASKEDADRAL